LRDDANNKTKNMKIVTNGFDATIEKTKQIKKLKTWR
jgi:hypothetical protein